MKAESRTHKEPARAIAEHNEAFSLWMGVAVVTLSCLSRLELRSAVTMLGIGLSCAGIALLEKK